MGSQRVRHDWATSHLVTQPVKNLPARRRPGFNFWVGKIPWRKERLPTPVFWPGEFHGRYSPWGRNELDTTEWLSLSQFFLRSINYTSSHLNDLFEILSRSADTFYLLEQQKRIKRQGFMSPFLCISQLKTCHLSWGWQWKGSHYPCHRLVTCHHP